MEYKEHRKTENHTITINDKQIDVKVITKVYHDDMFNPGTDLELQEDKDAVYNGKYTPVTISVACFVEGFRLGDDALGGVLISEPNDIQQTINEYSMVANALSDCRDSLLKLVNLVTKV